MNLNFKDVIQMHTDDVKIILSKHKLLHLAIFTLFHCFKF